MKRASDPEFGAAALAAAKKWRWEPAKEDGKPVEVSISIPFQFDDQ
jgi:TonB family protein